MSTERGPEEVQSPVKVIYDKGLVPFFAKSLINPNGAAHWMQDNIKPGEILLIKGKINYLIIANHEVAGKVLAQTDKYPRASMQNMVKDSLGYFVSHDNSEYTGVKEFVREKGSLLRKAVAGYTDAINEETLMNLDEIIPGDSVDANKLMFNIMSGIAPRTLAGGHRLPADITKNLVKVMAGATNPPLQITPGYLWANFGVNRNLEKFVIEHKGENLGLIGDLFEGYSKKRAISEIKGILVAALETVKNTLVYATKNLADHPEIYEKLREEALSAKSPEDLVLARATFLEASRMLPIAWRTLRQAAVDSNIAGQNIDAGTMISTAPFIYHFDQSTWGANANEFYPQRFIDKPSLYNDFHDSWNRGTHICAGVNLAIVEGTLILHQIAKEFKSIERVNPNEKYEPSFEASVQMRKLNLRFNK